MAVMVLSSKKPSDLGMLLTLGIELVPSAHAVTYGRH